jgi:glycosidase
MLWDDLDYDAEFTGPDGRRVGSQEVKFDRDLHAFFRAAIALRRNTPALHQGSFRWLAADDAANTLVFGRSDGQSTVVVAFNRSESPQTVRIAAPSGWPDDAVQAGFVSDGGSAVMRRSGDELLADLAPLTAAVFLP